MQDKKGAAKNLGTRLRQWRKTLPLKSFELAKLIKISQGSLSDIENNKSLPSADTIAKLYLYTDLNIIWLLLGKGPMTRDRSGASDLEEGTLVLETMQDYGKDQKLGEVVEHNFTLLAEDAPDRTYVLPDGELEDPRMASAGKLPDIQTLGMRDEFFGFELQLKYSPSVELWRFPVETVSQSEEGFESIYQGSCIAGCWRVKLEPGQSRQLQAGLGI